MMIYISAQPDQTYFIWQLEIQLRNFRSMGINKELIQVLVSFKPETGLNPDFRSLIDKNSDLANFYTYPDLREKPKYTSSIRPNILKQHFEKYPELEKETLCYHDSDILFSRIPQIEDLEANATCYVSDTRNYLDIDYIRRTGSEQLLSDMASIVGISIETVEKNKQHTGGAQYILKGIDATFWEKVERDSEDLYVLMKDYNKQLWEREYADKKEYRSKKRGIQAWCADMWAVLWNLWQTDKKVEIHAEMDFSWPYSPIAEWEKKAIQHYSGNIEDKDKFFKKNEYLNYVPWYDDALLTIPDTNCSYKIVEMIRSRKDELDSERPCFSDSCTVYDGREYHDELPPNFKIVRTYIQKYLDVDVYLLMDNQQIRREELLNSKQCLSTMLYKEYKQILWMPLMYCMDAGNIEDMLQEDCYYGDHTFYPEVVYKVDQLFAETFSKTLDVELLHVNRGKFNTETAFAHQAIWSIKLPSDKESSEKKLTEVFSRQHHEMRNKSSISAAYRLI